MVAAELGVDTLERGVTLSLRLLDTVRWKAILAICFLSPVTLGFLGRVHVGVGLGSSEAPQIVPNLTSCLPPFPKSSISQNQK